MTRRSKNIRRKKHPKAKEHQNDSPPVQAAAREIEGGERKKFYFFYQSTSPFSQWYPSKYELNGVQYSCAEQGMMHGKALLFHDVEIADQILEASHPRKIKALGRKVRRFNPQEWNKHRERIVYENSVAKFSQNNCVLEALLETKGSILVEASPSDTIWGIGLSEAAAKCTPPESWPGLNLLGKVLTQVREEILATGNRTDNVEEDETKGRLRRMKIRLASK